MTTLEDRLIEVVQVTINTDIRRFVEREEDLQKRENQTDPFFTSDELILA